MNISADHDSNHAADNDLTEVAHGVDDVATTGAENTDQSNAGSGRSILEWLGFNLVLLILYVGFFHLCLLTRFPISLGIGLAIAATMTYLCVRFYRLFTNRYEFLFYLALPLDVALEGLIPFHSGYSFYWCAAAFWLVFGLYRAYRLMAKS
jgi:hypothetical protein